jgi:hypothetical protein
MRIRTRSTKVPTVEIDDGQGGTRIINESDYDSSKHRLAGKSPSASRSFDPVAESEEEGESSDDAPARVRVKRKKS